MRGLTFFALLVACWGHAEDGVFLRDPAADVQVKMEGPDIVVRIPTTRISPPKARCILLENSAGDSELIHTPEGLSPLGLYAADRKPSPRQGCVIVVILDTPPVQDRARSVVVKGKVFLDVQVSRSVDSPEAGWLSLPVNADKEYAGYLQAAGQLFGIEKNYLFDLRQTDEQLAKPASVEGPLSKEDIAEIRRTVYAMARQQILAVHS